MLNSVGLQNPGVEAWLADELPALRRRGRPVVASIWGFTVEDYEKAAAMLADAPDAVVAVEVNLSCPNIEASRRHVRPRTAPPPPRSSPPLRPRRPRWAKLSPNVTDLVEIAGAALDAGAEALTLVNTVMGMAIDPETRRPRLGSGEGAAACPAPPSTRSRCGPSTTCRRAFPDAPIVGVGGVATRRGRGRAAAGRGHRGAGRHGHLRRPPGAAAGAARAGAVVPAPRSI